MFFFILLTISCSEQKETHQHFNNPNKLILKNINLLVPQGQWIGRLNIQENKQIPFNFEVIKDSLFIINSTERIGTKIYQKGDSMIIKTPVFDSEFHFKKTASGLAGYWYNNAKVTYKLYFTASVNKEGITNRFGISENHKYATYDGKWETDFSPGSEQEYKAIAIFSQEKQYITGTFITQTGDYRFLQGSVHDDSILLSCFDGSHAFLFEGRLIDDTINGRFYSGSHWSEKWTSFKNESFSLPSPYLLTSQVKEKKLEFTFPNTDGEFVSYPNSSYKDKVVIIQVLGSWCPNCVDEAKLFTAFHKQYNPKGLEIIALAFEAPEKLSDKIKRAKDLKSHLGANYAFLIAGNARKKEAQIALPVLSEVTSFPTTIFIGKKGLIRKIHTGFYGPATGDYYTKYVADVTQLLEDLLSE